MTELVTDAVSELGYLGVFLLMLLESIFPPIPSELILPFAGFAVARGELSFLGVLLAASAGSVVGCLPWYLAGRWLGVKRLKGLADRFGRWFAINSDDIDKATAWFERFGTAIVFAGRLVPLVRTLISVPAGVSSMHFAVFLIVSAIGGTCWNLCLLGAGMALGQHYEIVGSVIDPVSLFVLVGLVALYVYRVIVWRPGASAELD